MSKPDKTPATPANLSALGLSKVEAPPLAKIPPAGEADPMPRELSKDEETAVKAEEQRKKKLKAGWNNVRDFVLVPSTDGGPMDYAWCFYVSWFPKDGEEIEEGMLSGFPTMLAAKRAAVVLNQCGAVPAWL